MKNPWVIIGIITVVLFGGSFWYASNSAEKNNEGVEIIAHTKGAENGSVTLVEYSDFSCPACAAFSQPVRDALDIFGEDVTFEYRHFPFLGTASLQAAVATEAAGQQGKFYEFHDLLFENQERWVTSPNPQALFLRYGEELDLDMDQFRRHINSTVIRDHVQADFAEGRSRGITGTPTFFLNGQRMQIETFQDFIMQIGAAVSGEPIGDGEEAPVAEPDITFGI